MSKSSSTSRKKSLAPAPKKKAAAKKRIYKVAEADIIPECAMCGGGLKWNDEDYCMECKGQI